MCDRRNELHPHKRTQRKVSNMYILRIRTRHHRLPNTEHKYIHTYIIVDILLCEICRVERHIKTNKSCSQCTILPNGNSVSQQAQNDDISHLQQLTQDIEQLQQAHNSSTQNLLDNVSQLSAKLEEIKTMVSVSACDGRYAPASNRAQVLLLFGCGRRGSILT